MALFLTGIKKEEEKKKIYSLLESSKINQIPFVHLTSETKPEEIEYLISRFQAKIFNIHSQQEYPLTYDYSKYRKKIYIENTLPALNEKELKNFAGICLDFSHLENDRLTRPKVYRHNFALAKKYSVGANHISAIKKSFLAKIGICSYGQHRLNQLSELDYLRNYPEKFFSSFLALELENSFSQQVKIKEYLFGLFD